MEIKRKEIYNKLPQQVKDILFQSNGWLVGSAVKNLLEGEEVRDYDVLITDIDLYYKIVSSHKSEFNRFTSFGGINLNSGGLSIDIWHQSLESFILRASSCGIMYNLNFLMEPIKLL